jgi:long-chain acyl-CoA synthetase
VVGRDTRFVPWAQVLEDARTVAAHLGGQGVAAGARVGIRAENSYEWIVLDIALLALGAVPVAFPVNEFKGERNCDLAERYALSAMYAERGASAADEPPFVGRLDQLLELRELHPLDVPSPAGEEQAFTLAFSSGTAGRLKCVMVGWAGCLRLIEATAEAYAPRRDDRVLIALPLATFQQRYLTYLAIHSDFEVVLSTTPHFVRALEAGSPTIVLGPPSFYELAETRFANLGAMRRGLMTAGAVVAAAIPVAPLRRRARRALFAPIHKVYGGAIRLMLVGSAPVRPDTLRFFERAGFPLFQIYGMFETGFVSWNTPAANRAGSVGRPVYPGTVSIGDDGEVLVRHPWHLCLGYAHDSRADEPNVFPGDQVIATGDLGEFDAGGFLHLRGRKKNLLISRGGLKVQLEELEQSLCTPRAVRRVAVFEHPSEPSLAVAAWFDGDAEAARTSLTELARQANAGLPLGLQIRSAALIAGSPEPGGPLMNRNLKLNRDAVRREFEDRLEPLGG